MGAIIGPILTFLFALTLTNAELEETLTFMTVFALITSLAGMIYGPLILLRTYDKRVKNKNIES